MRTQAFQLQSSQQSHTWVIHAICTYLVTFCWGENMPAAHVHLETNSFGLDCTQALAIGLGKLTKKLNCMCHNMAESKVKPTSLGPRRNLQDKSKARFELTTQAPAYV